MVCTMLDCLIEIRRIAVQVEDLAGHHPRARDALFCVSAGDSGYTDAVVADGGDDACHMRPVTLGGNHGGRVVVEVEAAGAVFQAWNQVAGKVLMLHVHALVHYRDDDIAPSYRKLVPDLLDIDVGALVAGVD